MPWTEFESGEAHHSSAERTQLLNQARSSHLPIAVKEAASGAKAVAPIDFQPVQSPGTYEAEFAIKDEDLIFHFWPWGFHAAQEANKPVPRFKKGFETILFSAMGEVFNHKTLETHDDRDMGAIFVRVPKMATNEFYRKLAIKVCELIHQAFSEG